MVATTALLADLVDNVGGNWVEVVSLLPPGADVHSFQTTPADSIVISRARVIVSNGFGLDSFLENVVDSAAASDVVRIIAAEGLDPSVTRTPLGAQSPENAGQTVSDPHLWQNPQFTIHYVESIRDGLSGTDPDHAADYQANAASYIEKLRALDSEIVQTLSQVSPNQRHLVTFHSAFGHFAQRYDWKSSAFVDTDADDVSPASIVRILDQIKDESLGAIFVEPQFSTNVVRRAADDAGVAIGSIFASLSDLGSDNYLDMMRTNAQSLAENLK